MCTVFLIQVWTLINVPVIIHFPCAVRSRRRGLQKHEGFKKLLVQYIIIYKFSILQRNIIYRNDMNVNVKVVIGALCDVINHRETYHIILLMQLCLSFYH